MSLDKSPSARQLLLKKLPHDQRRELRTKVSSLKAFADGFVGIRLWPYQLEAANAIVKSVLARDGESFVLIFARQSGKDELIANLILYVLARLAEPGASIVCAQPTFQPQTINAMDRLEARTAQRPFFKLAGFHRSHGYIFELLAARVTYLSADPSASVVGATAGRLLIINEAQDVQMDVYDKRFAPMAASGNATRLFSGTAWTGDTLLDREKRLALELEKKDGLRRLFVVDGEQVARSNRLYGKFLRSEISKLGRQHPLIRTQYFCENIDARGGMFTPAHRLLMRCDRPAVVASPIFGALPQMGEDGRRPEGGVPSSSTPYAFLLDIAGQEESSTSYRSNLSDVPFDPHLNSQRDAVTLRIVEIDLSTLPTLQAPTYRAVHLQQWTGQNHLTVFGQLKALAESWRPQHIVMDATGVGEGLWAMLDKAFPTRVIPVKFTQGVKSELGYGFLAIINTGRLRDCCDGLPSDYSPGLDALAKQSDLSGYYPSRADIDLQYAACESEVLIGPARTVRWGVPDGRRDSNGRLIHDDIPVTDSLTTMLDRLNWQVHFDPYIIRAPDPLDDMDRFR